MSGWHHRIIATFGLQPLAYRLVEAYYELYFRHITLTKSGRPIIVYQMGKVGSSSLVATLEQLVPNSPIYHIHHLTGTGMEETRTRSDSRNRAFPGPDYWQAQHVRSELAKQNEGGWELISLTRDPVARNVSGFFQSLSIWSADALERYTCGARESLFEQLLDIFLQDYPHHKPHTWFDSELKAVFGIDVYDVEFDKSIGYSIYAGDNVHALVIRLEDLSRCYRQALAAFLGKDLSGQSLVRVNEAGQKAYRALYHDFLNWLVLPGDYLESQYGTRYARHFYSSAELNRFLLKWQKVSS